MKQQLSSKIIQDLEDHMMMIISQHADSDYELTHYRNVCKYSLELARIRNLKEDRAVVAAILHDIGRLLPNQKKKHAAAGASLAKSILQEQSLNEKTITKICNAIRNHSEKSEVGTLYDELLKDADSLAHREELEYDGLRWMEQIRCDYAYETKYEQTAYLTKKADLCTLTSEIITELKKCLAFAPCELFQKSNIHRIRILSNQLRTLCRLMETMSTCDSKELSNLNKKVQKLYKETARLRETQVYLGMIPESTDWIEERRFLKDIIKREEEKFCKWNWSKVFEGLYSIHFADPERNDIEDYVRELFSDLKKNTVYFEKGSIKNLHKLRIQGKKLLYLKEYELLEICPQLLEVLKNLHSEIGSYHDLTVLCKLFYETKQLKSHPGIQLDFLNQKKQNWFQDQMDENNDKMKKDLLRLKIILSKYL